MIEKGSLVRLSQQASPIGGIDARGVFRVRSVDLYRRVAYVDQDVPALAEQANPSGTRSTVVPLGDLVEMVDGLPRLFTDYSDDEATDPGLPSCTIIGPLLPLRAPAPPRVPYHVRYPPPPSEPLTVEVQVVGMSIVVGSSHMIPPALSEFPDDDHVIVDVPEPELALGSQSHTRKPTQ